MVKSEAWKWEYESSKIWLEPCEESYYYIKKWKREGKESVLDLGCGLGRHSIVFAKNGFDVTAVDLSSYAINHLNKWSKKEGLNVSTYVADMINLPLEDNSFDCLWSYHVISHTDTLGFIKLISEIKRVLKPKGVIYITLCSKDSPSFSKSDNIIVDKNTIIKSNSVTEKDIPHFYVEYNDIFEYFNDFNIRSIRHINDCYHNGIFKPSVHYFIEATKL